MRKRIAIFANGWGYEYLQKCGNGMRRAAMKNNIDMFTFVNFTSITDTEIYNKNEHSIFSVPVLADFDGVVLLTNSFNLSCEIEELMREIKKYNIPMISMEIKLEGGDYIGIDNYSGMYTLAEHVIVTHDVKELVLVGGIKGHEESEERMRAALDAAKNQGIEIPGDHIIYANWASLEAKRVTGEWIKCHNKLPDAFLCANDSMAFGVMEYLQQNGYKVPKECIVTGYDELQKGQRSKPTLTTVSHKWEEMGKRGIELLIEKMQGRKTYVEEKISSEFVRGESCGCKLRNKRFYRMSPIDGFSSDQHFRHLYTIHQKCTSLEKISEFYSSFMEWEHWMEGDSYMLCLNSSFFREDENVLHLLEDRFEEMVDGVCILNMGKAEKSKRMKTNKAFFHFSDLSKRADSYIVTPVCGEGKVYGYGVLKRDFDICENNVLYIWTRHMGQFLQQVRFDVKMEQLNEKLERLSVTDALTGVYNRTGLERIVAPFMERISADGKQGMIFIADIDCMKNINDTRGHSAGDLAIRTVADTLRESVPDGFMVVRYGGDEFVVMGEAMGKLTMERIIDEISVGLESICKERKIDFILTISVGGYLMEAGEKFDLVRSLQKADENMYAVKSMHHEVLKKQEKKNTYN